MFVPTVRVTLPVRSVSQDASFAFKPAFFKYLKIDFNEIF